MQISVIIIAFGIIHLIEVSAYLARFAGVRVGSRASAYSLQNAVQMLTRFFTLLLLPFLGLLVDLRISSTRYLVMCSLALLGASLATLVVLMNRRRVIASFVRVLDRVTAGSGLMSSLVLFPRDLLTVNTEGYGARLIPARHTPGWTIAWQSSIVFGTYATSIFAVFYLGLLYPDYRTSLSHLSGASNAAASVVLTFWIEPRISHAIDIRSDLSPTCGMDLIINLLVGRFVGVLILGQTVVMLLWLVGR